MLADSLCAHLGGCPATVCVMHACSGSCMPGVHLCNLLAGKANKMQARKALQNKTACHLPLVQQYCSGCCQ